MIDSYPIRMFRCIVMYALWATRITATSAHPVDEIRDLIDTCLLQSRKAPEVLNVWWEVKPLACVVGKVLSTRKNRILHT